MQLYHNERPAIAARLIGEEKGVGSNAKLASFLNQ
jgi:hypothetical protein